MLPFLFQIRLIINNVFVSLSKRVYIVQSGHYHHLIVCNLFSLWYGWKHANLTFKNNHSFIPLRTLTCHTNDTSRCLKHVCRSRGTTVSFNITFSIFVFVSPIHCMYCFPVFSNGGFFKSRRRTRVSSPVSRRNLWTKIKTNIENIFSLV